MKKHNTKMKGKKVLSMLLALIMVLAIASPAFSPIIAKAASSYPVELAFNNLFVFDNWARNKLSTTIIPQDEDNPYGKLVADIRAGSVTITKFRDAPDSFGGIYTAHGLDDKNPDSNANYYEIDVEPNTTYTFSYTLENTNYTGFNAIVFYFDSSNKFVNLAAAGATNLNGSNSWSFTTPANADRIQIRFTVANGGGETSGTVKDIMIQKNEVLPLGNIFDFSNWASNEKSSALAVDYGFNSGTHQIDDVEGSVSFEANGSIFTNFNLQTNEGFYTMDVEPSATYSVSYNLLNCTLVNSGVALAWYTETGEFITYLNLYATNFNGLNTHYFTTPVNAATMQIAFGAFHGGSTGTAVFKDISVNLKEINNLFDLNGWANNPKSSAIGLGDGSVTPDTSIGSLAFTSESDGIYTGFGIDEAAANNGFYTVDVKPNSEYTLYYNFSAFNLPGPVHFQPHIVELDADNKCVRWQPSFPATTNSSNSVSIVTQPNTVRVQIVFAVFGASVSCTVRDIMFYASDAESLTGAPHRQVYEYDHSAADENFYDELPVANAPEGYVFAGWFTEPDGEGQRITPDTEVSYESYTVYPKYEPEVDTLEIASMPTKTVYTKGEKLNTAGLSLKATQTSTQMVEEWKDVDGDEEVDNGEITTVEKEVTRTFNINSGVYCTPEYLNTVGTQTITAHYGGKEVTFTVTVLENDTTDIVVNGTIIKDVSVTNNKYTLNSDATAFNRYKIAYSTDSYVRGIITFEDDITEEFFLEPNDNGNFVSFIDDFLEGNTHNYIKTVEFTCLDKEFGSFQLKAVTTDVKEVTGNTAYYRNAEYEMGIALNYGGVVSELYDIDDPVTARVYDGGLHPGDNLTPMTRTQIDYKNKLDEHYGLGYSDESEKVNLINTLDRGRYLQQSYYGTGDRPYEQGWFNSADWNYNPVQGGNVALEASKVIDYEITDNYVYVKARPLDWAKWSDEFAKNDDTVDDNGNKVYEPKWGEDYITDTYVEAWYYFEDGMIKVTNRKVDYSGLPENYTTQEFPALYLVEPLNHFVYNNVTADQAWKNDYSSSVANGTIQNIEEPEFWGIIPSYQEYHDLKDFDPTVDCNENWAAFTASEDPDSFGVGIYSASTTDFAYGVMPQVYAQDADLNSGEIFGETDIKNYRHAETINPSPELPTSYIAPVGMMLFKSYDPTEYTYYLTTGTAEQIRGDFSLIGDKEAAAELAKAKVAVPETVYMNPADNTNGQYYVNNILNEHDYYNVETVAESAETDMYFGLHIEDADSFKINVTNVTNSDNDIILGNGDGTGNREGETIRFDSSLIDSYISGDGFSLRLTNALNPGEIATAKWEITVTKKDGSTETHTAYTVLYAPERTVGAVAEARQVNASQHEISSWITGANGVDHSKRAPLGSFHGDVHDSGYFREDPLVYENPPTGGSGKNSHDYIITTDPSELQDGGVNENDDYSETAYVLQTATDDHDSSRAQSYLGLLTVDKSRYTNTDQIPNLRIGYDVLRIGSYVKNSLGKYTTYYTLGNESAYTATSLSAAPSGWTVYSGTYTDFADNHDLPYRESFVPSFAVSDIDGKYIHALNQGVADQTVNTNQYATAGTSVLCSVTDKSGLRDAVLNGYTQTEDDPGFIEKLEKAATILGDPSATQTEIDEARRELNENITAAYYSLKYDNLFSAYEFSQKPASMKVVADRGTATYENGTITVVNGAITDGEAYTEYGSSDNFYRVDLMPNTEYVFEYDVTTDVESQAFMFFYNAEGGNGDIPTNISVQTNGGAWESKTENNAWWGNYQRSAGTNHYTIKFTTGPNTVKASFRFGNTSNDPTTSTFSNIRLISNDKYYADATYSKTEDVYKEFSSYGTLITPVRTGYTFLGWEDANGNAVTGADIATEHKSIYSQWDINQYTITYDANGGNVTSTTQNYTIEDAVTLPTPTRDGYTFQGWKVTEADGSWEEGGICQAGAVPAGMYGNVKLTAQWTITPPTLVEDTVVIDFGLPVRITVLANDLNVTRGTLNAIGTGVADGTLLNTTGYTDRKLTGEAGTLTLANGTAQIVDGKIVYTPKSTNYTKEEVFYYEYKTTNNEYYYTTVTVIPATSIYFEESMFKFTDSKVTKNGDTYEYKWEDVGTTITGKFQSEDRPGTFTFADADANNVYGTDSAYNDSTTYSMGSAKYVEVDKNSIGNEPTAEFTFTGTGFDLFSVTDNKSGAIRVFIYRDTDNDGDVLDETNHYKNYVVNTYYGYEYNAETGEYTPVEDSDAAIFQAPVFRLRDFDYDTYRIVVKPMYSSGFDVNKTGHYGIYVDSVRIFDPMGTETELENKEVVKEAYKADGEYAPNYLELRDTILEKDENGNITVGTYNNSSLFFDGSEGNDVVNYAKVGPKNEVYLGKGQAIVFGISASSDLNISSLQIGMKLIGGSGDATVTVMNTEQKQPATITLTSATEQFYKLDSVVVWDQEKINAPREDSVYETLYPIVIMNTSDDDVVISLTSLKWGYTDDIETGSNLNLFVDENTRSLAYAAMQRIADVQQDNNEPQIDPLDKENVVVNFTDEPYTEGDSAKLTVTTEQQITRVTVDGVDLTECEIDENGKKCWTYTFDADKAGENNFVVVVYDYEGNPSETIVAQTVILDKPEDVTNNDAGDNNGSDNSDSNIIVGTDTFANNLLRMIFALIEKILSILGGGLA